MFRIWSFAKRHKT